MKREGPPRVCPSSADRKHSQERFISTLPEEAGYVLMHARVNSAAVIAEDIISCKCSGTIAAGQIAAITNIFCRNQLSRNSAVSPFVGPSKVHPAIGAQHPSTQPAHPALGGRSIQALPRNWEDLAIYGVTMCPCWPSPRVQRRAFVVLVLSSLRSGGSEQRLPHSR